VIVIYFHDFYLSCLIGDYVFTSADMSYGLGLIFLNKRSIDGTCGFGVYMQY